MVGGTGKTPVTEYLVSIFADRKIAILSRGYGRRTKGYILADHNSNADQIGDEPMQYFTKFPNVTVAVCEDRVEGVRRLQHNHDLILLDDAFQHRRLNAGLSILLFDYNTLFNFQCPFPTGNMRELWSGYKRSDLILITKAPSAVRETQKLKIQSKFNAKPVFYATIGYNELKTLDIQQEPRKVIAKQEIIALSGIAKPKTFIDYLSHKYTVLRHFEFSDHHRFSVEEIMQIKEYYTSLNDPRVIIITTEKDIQRLNTEKFREILITLPIHYLPVQIEILEAEEVFKHHIQKYVSSNSRN